MSLLAAGNAQPFFPRPPKGLWWHAVTVGASGVTPAAYQQDLNLRRPTRKYAAAHGPWSNKSADKRLLGIS